MERVKNSTAFRLTLLATLSLGLMGCPEKGTDQTDQVNLASVSPEVTSLRKPEIGLVKPISPGSGSSTATMQVAISGGIESIASGFNPETITVHLTSSDPSQITVSPSSLTFNLLTQSEQTVTVTRVPNSAQQFWQARITASAADLVDSSQDVTFSAWNEVTPAINLDRRLNHSAVWTGSQMCVWGGSGRADPMGVVYWNSGECYSPATNTWTSMTTTNAPAGRENAIAVWTGSQMCVWGGYLGASPSFSNSGGCYNPTTDTWSALSASPLAGRSGHIGVWTGSQMCIWGGYAINQTSFNDGACYSPASNTWTSISNTNAPTKRYSAVGIWTGSQMCIWGGNTRNGSYDSKNDGGCYDPAANSWASIPTINAPTPSSSAAAAWTGSQMCVWGGINLQQLGGLNPTTNGGGCYDPAAGQWFSISTSGAPAAMTYASAVWTGTKMCVWGGWNGGVTGSGGCYDPSVNQWVSDLDIYMNSPKIYAGQTVVWTGSEMCVWGGTNSPSVIVPLAEGACIRP